MALAYLEATLTIPKSKLFEIAEAHI